MILEYCEDFHRRNDTYLRKFRPEFVDILAKYLSESEILKKAMMTPDDRSEIAPPRSGR